MATDIALSVGRMLEERERDGVSALVHVLGSGDISRLSDEQRVGHYLRLCKSLGLEPGLDRPSEHVDDLPVQAPRLALRAFLEGCVKIGWQSERQRGAANPFWKGGIRRRLLNGYVQVRIGADHPFASMGGANGFVLEHRLVMAEVLGRPLTRGENVHHINGIRADNRPVNLELWNVPQPPGIRRSDQHCPGCRCQEAP